MLPLAGLELGAALVAIGGGGVSSIAWLNKYLRDEYANAFRVAYRDALLSAANKPMKKLLRKRKSWSSHADTVAKELAMEVDSWLSLRGSGPQAINLDESDGTRLDTVAVLDDDLSIGASPNPWRAGMATLLAQFADKVNAGPRKQSWKILVPHRPAQVAAWATSVVDALSWNMVRSDILRPVVEALDRGDAHILASRIEFATARISISVRRMYYLMLIVTASATASFIDAAPEVSAQIAEWFEDIGLRVTE